jgi:hypothetical protein
MVDEMALEQEFFRVSWVFLWCRWEANSKIDLKRDIL